MLRHVLVTAFAVALGAWLSIGDLRTSAADTAGSDSHLLLSSAGLVVLVALAGFHAVWLLPAATLAFAVPYEAWAFDPPPGVALVGGMDSIGMHPTDVVYSLVLALPVTALLAALRRGLLARRTAVP